MNDSFSLYVLLSHPGVSPAVARHLIQLLGSAEAVLCERDQTEKPPHGVKNSLWNRLKNPIARKKAKKEWGEIEKNGVRYLDYRNQDFPHLLNHIPDSPLLLFYRGETFPRSEKILSVVGTRKPTKDALVFTKDIIEAIKPINPIIVSGLAEGVDAAAHKAALEAGLQTYACLAHGVNQCYPFFHKKLKAHIENKGDFNRALSGFSVAPWIFSSAQQNYRWPFSCNCSRCHSTKRWSHGYWTIGF